MVSAPLFCAAALTALAAASTTPRPQDPPAKPGIPSCDKMQKTASGLEWGLLRAGRDEPPPGPDDNVEVHYTGWLLDGTKFDSSRDRGQPATFPVSGVIPGWTEGLQLMAPGARVKLVIPADLAYGPTGQPPRIPPNATLVFDVELLAVARMPRLRPANPATQKAAASGVRWELLQGGAGAAVGADDGVALRYAIWRPGGELLDCTERQNGHKIGGTLAALPYPFLAELVGGRKVGDVLRCEVPEKLFPNAGSDTVWELEVVAVTAMPKFRLPARDKVVTTQSGLQYEMIETGKGAAPTAADTVLAHYTGWLTDGTLFDSSHARGQPTEFPLRRVIPGWTEGLQLMKPGGKFLFQIPPELGYGAQATGKIPANATLVFLVELVAVKER